jgi:hypothetical protein
MLIKIVNKSRRGDPRVRAASKEPNHINIKEDVTQARGCKGNKTRSRGFFFNGRMFT